MAPRSEVERQKQLEALGSEGARAVAVSSRVIAGIVYFIGVAAIIIAVLFFLDPTGEDPLWVGGAHTRCIPRLRGMGAPVEWILFFEGERRGQARKLATAEVRGLLAPLFELIVNSLWLTVTSCSVC